MIFLHAAHKNKYILYRRIHLEHKFINKQHCIQAKAKNRTGASIQEAPNIIEEIQYDAILYYYNMLLYNTML